MTEKFYDINLKNGVKENRAFKQDSRQKWNHIKLEENKACLFVKKVVYYNYG